MSRPFTAEIPVGPVDVPDVVATLAGGDTVTAVWRNELGGLTFRLEGAAVRYVKWVATGTPEIDLREEAVRLAWARRWATVPRVIEHGTDDEGAWLVTAEVFGRSAVDPRSRVPRNSAGWSCGSGA